MAMCHVRTHLQMKHASSPSAESFLRTSSPTVASLVFSGPDKLNFVYREDSARKCSACPS